MAKDKRLSETRSCLENNMDPVAKILGDAYATVDRKDNTMNRLVDQMLNVFLFFLNSLVSIFRFLTLGNGCLKNLV